MPWHAQRTANYATASACLIDARHPQIVAPQDGLEGRKATPANRVQIDIGEELAGQVADGQAALRRRLEQSLVRRRALKVGSLGMAEPAGRGELVKQNEPQQPGLPFPGRCPRPDALECPQAACQQSLVISTSPRNRHSAARRKVACPVGHAS